MQITSSWYICHYKHRIVSRAIIYLHLGHDLQFIYKKEKEGDLTRSQPARGEGARGGMWQAREKMTQASKILENAYSSGD